MAGLGFGLPAPLNVRSIRPKKFGLLIVLGLCRHFVGFICLPLMVLSRFGWVSLSSIRGFVPALISYICPVQE